MAIGLTEEHEALAASVRGFAERNITSQVVREGGEGVLAGLAAQGLPGLHLPEDAGGQGFGILEQAVALEELGRALVPGPYTPTVLASAVLHASGASKLPAGLADGSRTAAVGLSGRLELRGGSGSGTVDPVLGAPLADVFVLPAGERWVVLERDEVTVGSLESLDVTRPVGSVTVDGVAVPDEQILDADVRALAVVLLGAEACGVAGRALDDAVAYAKLREQFGRPIGQFQAVKHKCARMLIDVERARAAVWDAARALDEPEEQRAYALGVAAALAADAAVTCAEGNIQVHGGIGYTYEHDAHLIYRRALTLRALLGRASAHRAAVAALAVAGVRRPMSIDLPEEAEPLREEIRARVAELAAMEPLEQRAAMAEGGWVTPHLPKPWGRDAGPMEQIVIQQELKAAKVRPVPLMIAAWVVPSLVQYGTREQQERFLPP